MQTVTEQPSALKAPLAPPMQTTKKIHSRFGEIELDLTSKVTFKHGLLGLPEAVSFGLTDLPNMKTDQFKLLQSLDDDALSFIVVPSQYDNQIYEKADLEEACKTLGYRPNVLLVLFIVTVHEENGQRHVSVNAKAPILVDALTRAATQYVFQSSAYAIQHRIS
ncbi:MAG: flagellar assembly factor fliW [Rickettsiaceae bacterium]|jgi:flagellar assembly factor FliW|nr:flagellar assembly factor fliW [Rickettsiaceae bacterium]